MSDSKKEPENKTFSRRDFIKNTGILAGSAAILLTTTTLNGCAANTVTSGGAPAAPSAPVTPGAQPGPNPTAGPSAPKAEVVDGFRVITIGTSGPPISPSSTWPATLIQYKDKYFLVDCGAGATHGLMKAGVDPALVKNMLFTHHHVDHDSDYFTFAIGGWNGPFGRRSLNLVGPAGTVKLHETMVSYYKDDLEYRMKYAFPPEGLAKSVFTKEIKGADSFELDGIKISTAEMTHTLYTLAYRFEAEGKSIVVSGDTTLNPNIIALAKGADILVMDAHLPLEPPKPLPPAPKLPEVSPPKGFSEYRMNNIPASTGQGAPLTSAHAPVDDIVKIATEAGVKKLVLTHLPAVAYKQDDISRYFKDKGFAGNVIVAETLGKYLP